MVGAFYLTSTYLPNRVASTSKQHGIYVQTGWHLRPLSCNTLIILTYYFFRIKGSQNSCKHSKNSHLHLDLSSCVMCKPL